jgi:hypothetical protein
MIREIKTVRQDDPSRIKRWFTDTDYWDIFTWERDQRLEEFQVFWNKSGFQKGVKGNIALGILSGHVVNENDWHGNRSATMRPIDIGSLGSVMDKLEKNLPAASERVLDMIISFIRQKSQSA